MKLSEIDKRLICQLYEEGYSMLKIASIFNVSTATVLYTLKKFGIKRRSYSEAGKKYDINEIFFDVIDTEEKAYFLGLLYADGSVSRKNGVNKVYYRTYLYLKEEDKEIIYKLNNLIQPGKPIYKRVLKGFGNKSVQYGLVIHSDYISKKLIELGVIPNKTKSLSFPKGLNCNLYNHFIRGFFDGDGTICVPKNKRFTCFAFCGLESFLKELQEILSKELGLSKTKLIKHPNYNNNNIVRLQYFGKKQAIKFRDWLYNNASIYLARKYNKFYSI